MSQEPAHRANAPALRRLILCFDGTWNTPEDQTNVSRIYAAIADQHAGCKSQLKFYDAGVGTTLGSRITGGALGRGIDQNILEGYCWLINHYPKDAGKSQPEADGEVFDAGPEIFIFGFSRGAYTARSLAGLINRCGLPKLEKVIELESSRNGGKVTDQANPAARPDFKLIDDAWKLYRRDFPQGVEARKEPECLSFRNKYCRNIKVKFLGVWDAVGTLGVPLLSRSVFARRKYGFHDTNLGRIIEYAYHAIAIDEQREDYQATLWKAKHAVGTLAVEQRWFPGAHGNVGGGYEDDLLPDPPLKWMAEHALKHGLEFTDEFKMRLRDTVICKRTLPHDFELRGDEYLSPVRDSYAEFLFGAYRFLRALRLRGRYYRPMLTSGVGETIDETAHMKWAADPRYRPQNFAYAGRLDFSPSSAVTPVIPTAAPAAPGNI
ncbi:MAG TPA: DUF2235 domain-containing protein [Candidatus Binatia bacterium]|nr:DUF2235 domain-containing protein [Candidatus Binatia bacterium]